MDEYIKRKAALALVKPDAPEDEKAAVTIATAKKLVRSIIQRTPAADVAPVVHGEWVRPHWRNSNFCYDCSVCGNEVMHQEYRWRDKKIYPIYPWCGAKMDGGADNG